MASRTVVHDWKSKTFDPVTLGWCVVTHESDFNVYTFTHNRAVRKRGSHSWFTSRGNPALYAFARKASRKLTKTENGTNPFYTTVCVRSGRIHPMRKTKVNRGKREIAKSQDRPRRTGDRSWVLFDFRSLSANRQKLSKVTLIISIHAYKNIDSQRNNFHRKLIMNVLFLKRTIIMTGVFTNPFSTIFQTQFRCYYYYYYYDFYQLITIGTLLKLIARRGIVQPWIAQICLIYKYFSEFKVLTNGTVSLP